MQFLWNHYPNVLISMRIIIFCDSVYYYGRGMFCFIYLCIWKIIDMRYFFSYPLQIKTAQYFSITGSWKTKLYESMLGVVSNTIKGIALQQVVPVE